MHSSPFPEPPRLSARPGPVLLPPRPRSTSVPPIPITAQKVAKRYMPITENVTPPISPARASATEPEAPPPTQRPGRSQGRGKWRAPQNHNSWCGTKSQTRKRNSTQQKPRRHRPHAPCGQHSQIAHFRFSA